MVILAALIALLIVFFLFHHHTGPAHLAMIAGLAVFEMYNESWTAFFAQYVSAPTELISHIIYLALILFFPLLLYIRSPRGGMPGLLRLAEALIFSILLTSLISEPLAYFFSFDTLAHQISDFIATVEAPIVLAGIISAYFDILFCRSTNRR